MWASTVARLGAVALLAGRSLASIPVAYCSTQNTGSSFAPQLSIYQSEGLCSGTCADYAFGILQNQQCWCSNYIPADQTATGDCNASCPGYPPDLCGNEQQALFGYIAIGNNKPSGTQSSGSSPTSGSSSTTKSSSSSGSTTSNPTSETHPVTSSASTSSMSSSSRFTTSSSSDTTSATTTPFVSVQTLAGQPVTITVSNPAATTGGAIVANATKGMSGGAIAGVVIGCLLGVGLLVAAALWFFCFGRRRQEPEKSPSPESRYDPSIQNTLIENRRQSKVSQMSLMRNFLAPATEQEKTPVSPTDYLSPHNGSAFTDNRMKKDAVLYPHGSRHSTVSLRDNEDYSRPVLRLTNPD